MADDIVTRDVTDPWQEIRDLRDEIERLRTELDLHRANTREAIVKEVMTATERVSAALVAREEARRER